MRITILFILITTSLSWSAFGQEDPLLKELGLYDEKMNTLKDSAIVNRLNRVAKDSVYTNASRALLLSRKAYNISNSIEYYEGASDALLRMSDAKIYLNEYDSAMFFAEESLRIAKKMNLMKSQVKSHEMIGGIFIYKGQYESAISELFTGIKLAETFDKSQALTSYANVGHVFMKTENYEKSVIYCNKSLKLGEQYKDTAVMISSLNLLGLVSKRREDTDQALQYFEQGLALAKATRNLKRQSEILYNMSNIYFNKEMYDKGFELFDESMEISKVNGSYRSIAIGYHSQAITCRALGKFDEAIVAADSALEYALLSENYEIIMESFAMMAQISADIDDYEMGMTYLSYAYIYKDSLNYAQVNSAISEAEGKYQGEKKAMAAELKAAHQKEVNEQKLWWRDLILWIAGIVLLIVCFGIYMLLKMLKIVKAKNETVEEQKAAIEEQHKEITDSIQYAKRIQNAMIASGSEWKKLSNDVSIYFNPRDVVSGDFYWVHNNLEKNISVWAVADCTGHGVPGAFMSMLGIGFLNEIVIEGGCFDPGLILDRLRNKIISALENEDDESKDGMDISLCVWDRNTNQLAYAGANNGLWLLRDEEGIDVNSFKSILKAENTGKVIAEVAPDKMPIGKYFSIPPPFTTKKIQLFDGDTIILFTDGYADQFGGEDDKKFKYKQLKELLIELNSQPFKTHSGVLGDKFQSWKGEIVQTDDVCIVSVKVSLP